MTGMVDIHAHVLPGVDDGPATWDDVLAIVRMAAEDGITGIVSTSHMLPDGAYANKRADLLPLIEQLQGRLASEGLPTHVYPGGEVYLTPDTAARVKSGELLTYADAGRYILVELPSAEIPGYAEQALFDLQLIGLTPIIAHPERNQGVIREPQRLLDLVGRGILTQVTASSLRAKPFVHTAELLIRHHAAHFIATDTHGVDRRRPRLSVYYERLSQLVGPEGARRLLIDNPRCVIEGKTVPTQPVVPLAGDRPARTLIGRLFGRRR